MDRFYRGFIAGVLGGIPMNIWSLLAYALGVSTRRQLDWAAVMIYGRFPQSFGEAIYAQFIAFLWVGLLGIVFSLIIRDSTSRGLVGKGTLFGVLVGFVIFALPVLFGVEPLEVSALPTTISNHIDGLIWGFTMALTLGWLDQRFSRLSNRI